ncbi:hypothetical protein ACSZMM_16060 [Aeromonas caviae]|uniref:hypothetical protein n=1 Tax=Aeromonas TaxID=642 RepID=UPI0013766F89|nr:MULTISPECIES: hypothetical protein [Aeromonas]MDE8810875.1 hypothetical protein [Aeromonas hydrophila]USP63495.1 hypothetical protein J6625_06190 [Aeromonas caviae]WAF59089.1 hypothetical protein NRL03_15035 [Aeromonas caviae]
MTYWLIWATTPFEPSCFNFDVFQRKTAALRSSWFAAAVDAFVAGPRKVMLTQPQLVLDYNRR